MIREGLADGIILMRLLGGSLGILGTGPTCTAACFPYTGYLLADIESGDREFTHLSEDVSTAAAWTGEAFGVFTSGLYSGSDGARLMVVEPSGLVTEDSRVSAGYEWVVWTGEAFAGLWKDVIDEWRLTFLDPDGSVVGATGPVFTAERIEGFVWTGSHFVVAIPRGEGVVEGSFRLHSLAVGLDGTLLGEETPVGGSESVVAGALVGASAQVAAIWAEPPHGSHTLYTLHVQPLDEMGVPGESPVVIDEFRTYRDRDIEPVFDAAWAGDTVVVAYIDYLGDEDGWPSSRVLARTVSAAGEVGTRREVNTNSCCTWYEENSLEVATDGDRVAFSYCSFIDFDIDDYCSVDVYACGG